uniref:Fucolectin tachylectin-4 pentraxin-1 domain-containing protein n=1 Tax=Amphiprion percula TaxID=161767 RepID=A0A3P8TBW8_AMPPE
KEKKSIMPFIYKELVYVVKLHFTVTFCTCPGKSIARGGQVAQSSVGWSGIPERVIDGNRDSTYKQRSCSHTKRELKPWLRLDLLKMFKVKTFTITNRGDCCSDRLNGAEIRIGNSLIDNGNTNPICTVIKSITGGRTETFECYEMEGRYINIVIPDRMEYLTLCEVEVEGIEVSTDDDCKLT